MAFDSMRPIGPVQPFSPKAPPAAPSVVPPAAPPPPTAPPANIQQPPSSGPAAVSEEMKERIRRFKEEGPGNMTPINPQTQFPEPSGTWGAGSAAPIDNLPSNSQNDNGAATIEGSISDHYTMELPDCNFPNKPPKATWGAGSEASPPVSAEDLLKRINRDKQPSLDELRTSPPPGRRNNEAVSQPSPHPRSNETHPEIKPPVQPGTPQLPIGEITNPITPEQLAEVREFLGMEE